MPRNSARTPDGRLLAGDLELRISAVLCTDLLRLRTRLLRRDIVAVYGCCDGTARRAIAKARVIAGIERRMLCGQ